MLLAEAALAARVEVREGLAGDDLEANYLHIFDLAPTFAERLRAARRETRIVGTSVRNFFRKPFGPGWALVGDAGYTKDFITAQGIKPRATRPPSPRTISPVSWPRWSPRPRSCNAGSVPSRATRMRWTAPAGSTPA